MIKKIKNNWKKLVIALLLMVSVFLLTFGLKIFITHEEKVKNIHEIDKESLNAYFKSESASQTTSTIKPNKKIINYMAVIEIPKINLKQGIPYPNTQDNNVERNIEIINGSSTPKEENGVFILASHSGNSAISYFKDLYKLNKDDSFNIYYDGHKYTYFISDIYKIDKTGKLSIKRDVTKKAVVLVTCTKNSDTKQTVYIAYERR